MSAAISILAIGNSLSDNATRYLEALAAAGGVKLILGAASLGGCSLEKHWNLVEQCDRLPDVHPYLFRMTGRKPRPATLREALAAHRWQYVTLQQVSDKSWRPETYHPFIDNLHRLVRKLAPQAQPVIHQTWAYRCDSPSLKLFGIDQAAMHERIVATYAAVAAELRCPILPSGAAFQKARAVFKFVPDAAYPYDNPVPLRLPRQGLSLIVGHHWRTGNTGSGKAELHLDERHGNAKGCYLANAVWYERVTGRPVAENPFRPEGVSARELALLKKAAHAAVVEYGGSLRPAAL